MHFEIFVPFKKFDRIKEIDYIYFDGDSGITVLANITSLNVDGGNLKLNI